MIECRREVGPAVAELRSDLLDFGPRRHEDSDAPSLPHDGLYEPIVQELEWLLGQHVYLGGFGRIEGTRLEHLRGA